MKTITLEHVRCTVKSRGRHRDVLCTPCPRRHTASPTVRPQPPPEGAFVRTDGPVLTGQVVIISGVPFTLAFSLDVAGDCRFAPTPLSASSSGSACVPRPRSLSHQPAGPAERTTLLPLCSVQAGPRRSPGGDTRGHLCRSLSRPFPESQSRAEGRPEAQRSGVSRVTSFQCTGGAGDPEAEHLTREVHSDPRKVLLTKQAVSTSVTRVSWGRIQDAPSPLMPAVLLSA